MMDPTKLKDPNDMIEVAPGSMKRLGNCTEPEIKAALRVVQERRRVLGELTLLQRSAFDFIMRLKAVADKANVLDRANLLEVIALRDELRALMGGDV